jgi:aminoglycoside phosphotransferase (APT) family kinase protein
MTDRAALLMRAIGEELIHRIIPELDSADAIERATFARLVLQQLAAELDVLPEVAERLAPEFHKSIADALTACARSGSSEWVDRARQELAAIAAETDVARHREVAALRGLAARIVRHVADSSRDVDNSGAVPDAARAMARLGTLDCRWLNAYDAARSAHLGKASGPKDGGTTAPVVAGDPVCTESVTRYLRRMSADMAAATATSVTPIPGGRSKKTYFISIDGTDHLPGDVVMRQDYALRYEGTKVRDEYRPLARLAELDLPVPRPLHLEPDESELGPPFMLVSRLSGSPPGSYFGLKSPCPGAFRDMARMLAKLHSMTPDELGFTVGDAPQESLMQLIEQYQKKWRDNATQASPLIDYAYAWAGRECARDRGSVAVVHGDAGPYNMLVADDRLNALLDWEFAHVGDPAEDLGIARVYAEDVMDWREFLEIYVAAGGRAVPERRVRLAMVLQFLKGTTLVAASGRNFEEGWTREFIKGANAFTGLPLIELRIAALLERFEGV